MWYGLLLSLSLSIDPSSAFASEPGGVDISAVQTPPQQGDPEFDRRRKEAGNDVDKLWDVYKWCKEQKKDEKGRSVLRQLLKIDPKHEDANVALGNVLYDGKWFPSQKKADEYKKEQEEKQLKADGLVEYKGQRVPAADVPFLEKGMVRDDSGNWVDADAYKKQQEGWIRQDLEWIEPKDKENVAKGLWKCGDQWLPLDEANKYHSSVDTWWRIPTEHYRIYTTCDRAVALERVKKTLDAAWDDMLRVVQAVPTRPLIVVVLRDDRQYNTYAGGDEDAGIPGTDTRGLASAHYAYLSEVALDVDQQPMFAGVSYWDASSEDGNRWGPHAARSALGLAYVDAIDPSPKTMEKVRKTKSFPKEAVKEYYDEKRLPEWFRVGAATYAERYFNDMTAAQGKADWARKWSVENIVAKGGLRPLKQLVEKQVSFDLADVGKLMNEMGLVIAFAVDGKCAPVTEKLKALQETLKTDKEKKDVAAAASALAEEVMKHETDLRKFAGI
jgi:hypothetical protein